MSEPYDYIIIGGGPAGCLLANRLSADGTKRVLMLEAGRSDYKNKFIRIPAGVLRLFRSVYDWQFESSGEPHCNGRPIFLQRGKVRNRRTTNKKPNRYRPVVIVGTTFCSFLLVGDDGGPETIMTSDHISFISARFPSFFPSFSTESRK